MLYQLSYLPEGLRLQAEDHGGEAHFPYDSHRTKGGLPRLFPPGWATRCNGGARWPRALGEVHSPRDSETRMPDDRV